MILRKSVYSIDKETQKVIFFLSLRYVSRSWFFDFLAFFDLVRWWGQILITNEFLEHEFWWWRIKYRKMLSCCLAQSNNLYKVVIPWLFDTIFCLFPSNYCVGNGENFFCIYQDVCVRYSKWLFNHKFFECNEGRWSCENLYTV